MIRLEKEGGLWIVTIDRRQKANSLTRTMLEELARIAEGAHEGARAFVITGAGKVFSAGADLDEARAGLASDPVWEHLSGAIASLPCLTIAALNGTLAGGAFGMALACDLRIAVPGATFFYPVMKHGFLPQPSDPARLAAIAGPSTAAMILMAGARLSAEEALRTGLIDRLTPADRLLDEARSLAADNLTGNPEIAAQIRQMLHTGHSFSRRDGGLRNLTKRNSEESHGK